MAQLTNNISEILERMPNQLSKHVSSLLEPAPRKRPTSEHFVLVSTNNNNLRTVLELKNLFSSFFPSSYFIILLSSILLIHFTLYNNRVLSSRKKVLELDFRLNLFPKEFFFFLDNILFAIQFFQPAIH